MTVALIGPRRPMTIGSGLLALCAPLAHRDGSQTKGTGTPAGLPGLIGWWDASGLNGVLSPAGTRVTAWGSATGSIVERAAGGAPLAFYSCQPHNATPMLLPRLNGLLGGVGCVAGAAGAMSPDLDPDLGFQFSTDPFAAARDWTFYLVWSRPNWRQRSGKDQEPITLLTIHGVPVLQADSAGGQNRLVLLTGSESLILATSLSRRHTHSIVLRSVNQGGCDVWLDNVKVGGFPTAAVVAGRSGPTLLLHDGSPQGAAQCWFHEAAVWGAALSDDQVSTLLSYAARWARGARRGIALLFNGQSNAINYALQDGAAKLLLQGIAWHLGVLAANMVATTGDPNSHTMQSGHGIYPAVNGSYPGSFLADPGDGSDPETWTLGQDGNAVLQAVTALTSEDRSDICGIVWLWSETDSLRSYSEKSTFGSAARRFLSLVRTMLNATASGLPLIWWNAIPYGAADGMQMHREVVAEAAADPGLNVWIGNPQTSDSNPRGSTWDPVTGAASGGDYGHRDASDNQRFARLAAPIVARALATGGYVDTLANLPPDLPARGGPSIVHAYRASDTSVILTIAHDAGSDLKVPLQAAQGIGFAVMDGGSATNPGAVIEVASCARADATHLVLTLSRGLTHASPNCHLYYPYGATSIYRGNAVTDNYSELAKPRGWDIVSDLGADWSVNYPLAATFAPIQLSDTPL